MRQHPCRLCDSVNICSTVLRLLPSCEGGGGATLLLSPSSTCTLTKTVRQSLPVSFTRARTAEAFSPFSQSMAQSTSL